MTRKDFELIATTLQHFKATVRVNAHAFDALALEFADRLKNTNAQFNRDKFLRACGCDAH